MSSRVGEEEQFPAPAAELAEQIGHEFARPELLRWALTHRSYLNEHPELSAEQDNQRLEFLGDAVIQLVVSQRLMAAFVSEPEGRLTKMRARVVSAEGLAQVGRRLGLGRFLRLGRGEERSGGQDKESLLADCFEAVAGALFLDAGFEGAREVLLPLLESLLDRLESPSAALSDAKSRLQEVVQARHSCAPQYEVVREEGPDHAKRFVVHVLLAGHRWGEGLGGTKKAAEQAAATSALREIERRWGRGEGLELSQPPAAPAEATPGPAAPAASTERAAPPAGGEPPPEGTER